MKRRPRRQFVVGLLRQLRTFDARPGTHAKKLRVDVSERRQTFERRIDPAIERNVRRSNAAWAVIRFLVAIFRIRVPFPTGKIGIVMSAIDMLPDEPTNRAADQHVRREVLLSRDARRCMAAAAPYASKFVSGPGYSCAITLAIDHAAAACSDGNESPPTKKLP